MIDKASPLLCSFKDKVYALYEKSRETLDPLPREVRNEYYVNGNRSDFEKLYFRRRDYLSSCALLSLFDDRYLPELERVINAVCDEYCWALPCHTGISDEESTGTIDLFVAETGFALSEIYSVFNEKLSERIKKRIRNEVGKRVRDNYVGGSFWWESCNMNWAAVCAGCVGGSLIYLFPEAFNKEKERIINTIRSYLSGFTPDGVCREGASYWLYGFSAFAVFAELLYNFSGGRDNLFDGERVFRVAGYMSGCFLKGDTCVSFSDADTDIKADKALIHFLNRKYNGKIRLLPEEKMTLGDTNTKWINYYRHLIWIDYDKKTHKPEAEDFYSPYADMLVLHKAGYSFAFKGGNNGEPHNHNDLGSFIFSDEDGQVFCDLGAGRYTADYFNEKRYDIFCNSSFSHSVPVINGKGQSQGEEYTAPMTFEGDRAVCVMTKAYNEESIKSIVRRAHFKDYSVFISDSFELSGEALVRERFVSLRKAEQRGNELVFGRSRLKYPEDKVSLEITKKSHTPHQYDKEDVTVYCYDFILKENVTEVSFEITAV